MRGRRRGALLRFYPFRTARQRNAAIRECTRLVARALRDGSLVRQSCARCGKTKAEAHHDDYSKPFDVQWLCRYHHRLRDAELREAWRAEVKEAARNALPVAYVKRLAARHKPPPPIPIEQLQVMESRTMPRTLILEHVEGLVRQATEAMGAALDAEHISESQLARRLGVSRQQVGIQFAGGFRTLALLAKYAEAMGYDASVVLVRRESAQQVSA